MNISRIEQRVVHVSAQRGYVCFEQASTGRVAEVTYPTREGFALIGSYPQAVCKPKNRKLIKSIKGNPSDYLAQGDLVCALSSAIDI
ncbi:hypothetical protein PsAD2_03607 [Pseudovibrio axinellae]|uniref:Uncharacterized protein n=1 Tax=Pseudovibrio axinellae TaxID=989403 RepID=A0A165VRY3_9HYPH|nr:hypothetical protein PsAD2_03607 [Pseudovibrio axinellae]SER53004.1 hypothetical protein SAMN05421798_1124 [Pseudovibrio axinellae]